MGGIDGERRQHREQPLHEPGFQPGPVRLGQLLGLGHADLRLGQAVTQIEPGARLRRHQAAGAGFHVGQLLGRRAPVRRRGAHAGLRLTHQPGHADRPEFVEVRRADRQEALPLQQRVARVLGLLQHPMIEVEPGQLAIDEAVRIVGRDRVRRRRRRLLRGKRIESAGRAPHMDRGRPAGHFKRIEFVGLGWLGHEACTVLPGDLTGTGAQTRRLGRADS
jgi:hypothetical protein